MVAEPGSLFDRAEYAVPLDPDAPAAVPPALAVGCRVEVLAPSPYVGQQGQLTYADKHGLWVRLDRDHYDLCFRREPKTGAVLVRAL